MLFRSFPWQVHLIPFLYYVLYTFLIYQLILEIAGAYKDPQRKKVVEGFYVVTSFLVYSAIFLLKKI